MKQAIKAEEKMMNADPTEQVRRGMVQQMPQELMAVAQEGGKVWTGDEMRLEFEVEGFGAPFVVVRRRADGVRGSLEFIHSPRLYFNFVEDK